MTAVAVERASLRKILTGVVPVTIVAQALSFASSLALANVLGATVATDAYFLGLSVPMIAFGILLAAVRLGALPTLTEWRAKGDEGFNRLSSELFTGVSGGALLITIVTTAVAMVALPAAVAEPGTNLAELTRTTLLELAPLGVLGAMVGILGAILAAGGSFVPAAGVLALEPLAKTVFVLTLGRDWGATTLVVGNLVGSGLAVAVLWLVLRRRGVTVRLVRHANTAVLRTVFRFSVPLLISQSVLQVNPLVDRSMAAGLNSGSVTELELGLRIFAVPTVLLTGTLIGPLTATWVARFAVDGWNALRDSVTRALRAVIALIPPLAVAGLLAKDHLIALLYQGGEYTQTALNHTADVFGMLVLGLPAQVAVVVLSTLFIVRGDSVFPMKLGIANVLLNVGLNLALRPVLGIAGIALSTTLTFMLLVGVSALVAQRRWRAIDIAELRDVGARAAISTAAIAGAGVVILSAANFGKDRLGALIATGAIALMALIVHGLALSLWRGQGHDSVRSQLRTLIARSHA